MEKVVGVGYVGGGGGEAIVVGLSLIIIDFGWLKCRNGNTVYHIQFIIA